MRVGFLHSIIRKDEKLLIEEFKRRSGITLEMIDDRKLSFNLQEASPSYDVVLERCINHSRALQALRIFESDGITCVNNAKVAAVCGDKLRTAAALSEHNIPQPSVKAAFTEEAALEAVEELGYPVVMKPAIGSWGKLLAKINDRDAAEAVLEHKTTLGSYHHSIFFIQQYIEKHGREIRCYVVGNRCVAAIYSTLDHWIVDPKQSNVVLSNCPITPELEDLALRAAEAVGGGVLAIDIFESSQGLMVNEVSYTIEFHHSLETFDINMPKLIVDYVIEAGAK